VAEEFTRLAYESSLRSLDKQDAVFSELRARTGLVLAASALAASFLGDTALDNGPVLLIVLALLAFASSIGASIYVLLPKRDLVFSLAGSRVYEELYEFRDDIDEVYRRLAYDLDRFREHNDDALQALLRGFRTASIALAAEVIFLLLAVGGTLG
jgi:hypothetical protein